MRPHGKTKLGFFPLPEPEAARLKNCLAFPTEFSALDPCVGDGVAFTHLLHGVTAHRSMVEIDANRVEQPTAMGIETLQANAMDFRCPPEAVPLLYLNPPYDWESAESNNQRLEFVFLEHRYRWLKAGGVLLFVIPQVRLAKCARLLSEHFTDLRVFRLTEPACLEYKQIVVLATKNELEPLGDNPEVQYELPASEPVVLTHVGIALDEVEDLLLESAAYRQADRVLLPKLNNVRGRPLTPLHGGHVGLLCTAGMLNGVFGEGEDRQIAYWRSMKFTDHWCKGYRWRPAKSISGERVL